MPENRRRLRSLLRHRLESTRAIVPLLVLLAVAGTVLSCSDDPAAGVKTDDVGGWTSPRAKPRSDVRAAARVTHTRETVPANAGPNRYVPSRRQLAAFRRARNDSGERTTRANRLTRHVTGRSRLRRPSTDDLIQWVSHKWGIPTDLIRAQMFVESKWRQNHLGDLETVSPGWYERYPPFARGAGGSQVYQSLGIAQVKWTPDGKVGAGTEPLRWRSTAFNLDYYAATVRFYYDGACHWCGRGYGAGQAWNSVGAWYQPTPWGNADAQSYVEKVKQALRDRSWTRIGR